MLRSRMLPLLCLGALGLSTDGALALNQITLQPSSASVSPGGSAVLELRLAFDQQALGGGIVVEFDAGVAAFGGFSFDPALPDDPSLRLVCPDTANPLCDDFDDGGGARVLIAFGARLVPPACNPPLTGALTLGQLTLDAVALGQTAVTLREDDRVAGGLVGCIGVDLDAPSFSGALLTVSDLDTDGDGVGDPSDNCPALANPTQANRDADGLGDACDRCPDFATSDNADTDGNGRGNACECGDGNRDGRITVADIVSVNLRIFTPNPAIPLCGPGVADPCHLCDTTADNLCNVSDIVGVNLEIFSPGSTSRCARSPQ